LRAERGRRAELAVADYVTACGWLVLHTNRRVGRLELDLVIRDGAVAAIVEVRTRSQTSWQRALDSIDARKRARLRDAGERLWRDELSKDASIERLRFDIASVSFSPSGEVGIEYIKAAL
jgi:putative endonuclease